MSGKLNWKGALIGTLALPLAAVAQSNGAAPSGADQNPGSAPMGADPSQNANPADQGTMNKGAMNDTASTKEVTGTISSVSKHEVSLASEDGTKLTLHTDSATKVYKPSGATEKINALKEGQQIRASYDMKSDQPHALRIDVIQGTAGTKANPDSMPSKP